MKKLGSAGFTLVELLVVVAILGLIAVIALPSVSSQLNTQIRGTSVEIATLIRNSYNGALSTGRVHRVVFDFDAREYWCELGPERLLLHTEESLKAEEEALRFLDEEEREKRKDQGFSMAKSINRKKHSLPRGLSFKAVYTEQFPEPIVEGKAYTHFFPQGIAEQSIIQLEDSAQHISSLIVPAVGGKSEVRSGAISRESLNAAQ